MKVILTETQINRLLEQNTDLITTIKQMGFVPSGNAIFKHSQKPELTLTLVGDYIIVKDNGKEIAKIKTSEIEDLEGTIKSTSLKEQVIQGDKGDPYEYKKENGNYYAKKKSSKNWILTKGDMASAISKKFTTPKVGISTPKPYTMKTNDSVRYQRDTFDPYAQQTINQKKMGDFRAQQFSKGIVPVKKDSGIKPHYRLFSDFLSLRKNPVTTKDFTRDELKTILDFIKNSKVDKTGKNVNFSSDISFSKVKSGEESQLNPDMKKAIGYTLGNAQVKDMGGYYKITDIYDFNNFYRNPKKYSLNQLPSTVATAFNKIFSGNLVQGVEELASYYQKLGYKGIPVEIDIPKNLS
jgi:hypothetical protein